MKRQIVVDQTYAPMFLQWMKERIGAEGDFSPDECRTIASVQFNEDGSFEILAVAAFNRWTPSTCEGNIASDGTKRWFSRAFAYVVYDYAFNYAGKSRINFSVSVDNKAAISMHESLGHEYVGLMEDAFGEGKDAYLYGLTRNQWIHGKWNSPPKINIKNKEIAS